MLTSSLPTIAALTAVTVLAVMSPSPVSALPSIQVVANWQVQVAPGSVTVGGHLITIPRPVTLTVSPTLLHAQDEKYDHLPLFNDQAAPWTKGVALRPLATHETTSAGSLRPETFRLKPGPGIQAAYQRGKDYQIEPQWATLGRLPGGIAEGQAVWADYDYSLPQLDAVVVNARGVVTLRAGVPHPATPRAPQPAPNETVLANIWLPANTTGLTADNIYPIVEPTYPEPKVTGEPAAASLLPKTWSKLHQGLPVHVLAWGDSVTAGGQASDVEHRYQNRFVKLLKARFPRSEIALTTNGWGGRNTDAFLKEPPGSPFNFEATVLAPHPDLIVMEFVNDSWMTPDVVEERYAVLLKRFQEIGAEWIILTPHFVRPDWMGLKTARVETDPRPYVAGLRQFAATHHVALADASLRWGHLVKEGIPYPTLLSNCINHPDDRGHEMFARSLMELFGGAPP